MAGAVFATPAASREGIVQKALRKDMFIGGHSLTVHLYSAGIE